MGDLPNTMEEILNEQLKRRSFMIPRFGKLPQTMEQILDEQLKRPTFGVINCSKVKALGRK